MLATISLFFEITFIVSFYTLATVSSLVAMASHSIPLPILDDLGSRFIINIPDEERKDIIRIMFQVGGSKFELSELLFFPNGAIYT